MQYKVVNSRPLSVTHTPLQALLRQSMKVVRVFLGHLRSAYFVSQ